MKCHEFSTNVSQCNYIGGNYYLFTDELHIKYRSSVDSKSPAFCDIPTNQVLDASIFFRYRLPQIWDFVLTVYNTLFVCMNARSVTGFNLCVCSFHFTCTLFSYSLIFVGSDFLPREINNGSRNSCFMIIMKTKYIVLNVHFIALCIEST